MRCKQHQACQNNKLGNGNQCAPDKGEGEGSSVCRQCCDDRTDKCNLELYQQITSKIGNTQQSSWEIEHVKHHTLPPTVLSPTQAPIGTTQLWNLEIVRVNDQRAIAQKLREEQLAGRR